MQFETDMEMKIEVDGRTIPNHSTQTQYQNITVKPIASDGSQQINVEVKRIVMKQMINGQKIEFDSADDKAQFSPFKILGIMVGLKVTISLDQDGKITKMEGLDEFLEQHAQNIPKQAFEMLKRQFSDKSLAKMFDILRETMPQQPVAVGEQWKSESVSEILVIGKVKTEQTNTLKEIQSVDGTELATIVSQSRIKSDSPQEMEMAATKMTLKSTDVDSESTIQMEMKTGLVVSNITQINMKIETETINNNKTLQQTMTGKGKTTMTITRTEK